MCSAALRPQRQVEVTMTKLRARTCDKKSVINKSNRYVVMGVVRDSVLVADILQQRKC